MRKIQKKAAKHERAKKKLARKYSHEQGQHLKRQKLEEDHAGVIEDQVEA